MGGRDGHGKWTLRFRKRFKNVRSTVLVVVVVCKSFTRSASGIQSVKIAFNHREPFNYLPTSRGVNIEKNC